MDKSRQKLNRVYFYFILCHPFSCSGLFSLLKRRVKKTHGYSGNLSVFLTHFSEFYCSWIFREFVEGDLQRSFLIPLQIGILMSALPLRH